MSYSFHKNEEHIRALCNVEKGYFVDIGAHDGVTGSATKYFEDLGWEGVCVEPLPKVFQQLVNNRKCVLKNVAISDKTGYADFLEIEGYSEMLSGLTETYDPRHVERIKRELEHYGGVQQLIRVQTAKFEDVVSQSRIDFLSLDTEGSEMQILNTIDFDKFDIRVVSVENNFMDPAFDQFFVQRGYRLDSVWSNCDQVFVKITL
jgi:FkbM family methyltransferase